MTSNVDKGPSGALCYVAWKRENEYRPLSRLRSWNIKLYGVLKSMEACYRRRTYDGRASELWMFGEYYLRSPSPFSNVIFQISTTSNINRQYGTVCKESTGQASRVLTRAFVVRPALVLIQLCEFDESNEQMSSYKDWKACKHLRAPTTDVGSPEDYK